MKGCHGTGESNQTSDKTFLIAADPTGDQEHNGDETEKANGDITHSNTVTEGERREKIDEGMKKGMGQMKNLPFFGIYGEAPFSNPKNSNLPLLHPSIQNRSIYPQKIN